MIRAPPRPRHTLQFHDEVEEEGYERRGQAPPSCGGDFSPPPTNSECLFPSDPSAPINPQNGRRGRTGAGRRERRALSVPAAVSRAHDCVINRRGLLGRD